MTRDITGADSEHLLDEGWSTPLEAGVRGTIRGFIETLAAGGAGGSAGTRALRSAQDRGGRACGGGSEARQWRTCGQRRARHGRRERQVLGSFGAVTVALPRASRYGRRAGDRVGQQDPARLPPAHAPKRLAEEIKADYTDMIFADSPLAVEKRRKAFVRKWRDKCEAAATSLEEAGDQLFTFTRLPVSQWKSARTTNAIERLHPEFKRRIKTQTVLPSAETAAIERPLAEPIDLAA